MADMSGWGSLGQALAGGGNTEAAYQRGQVNAARVAQLLSEAQIKRDEQLARQNLESKLATAGSSPEQAGLLATALRGGFNPTQISGYTGDVQEQGFRGDSVARALAGDWNGANANLMGVANGPVALASVEGQNLINNRLLAGGGGISTTEQGQAGIKADAARAAAGYASAASANASAARTRQGMGIDAAKFGMQRTGQWNPGGKLSDALAGKPLSAPVVTKLVGDAQKLSNLGELVGAFQDGYAGNVTGGALENTLGRLGWTGGITGATPGQADWWQQYDRYKNEVRNELFGASLTPGEAAAFEQADVNPNMDPKVVKTNLAKQAALIKTGLERSGKVWASQGFNRNAIAEATGLSDVFSGAAPTGAGVQPAARPPSTGGAPVQRARNPATGQSLILVNGQWVPE